MDMDVADTFWKRPFLENVSATWEDQSKPSIHVLSDECMDIVLSFFNIFERFRLSLVCKRWYNLCTSKMWTRMDHLAIVQLNNQCKDINPSSSISDEKFMSLVIANRWSLKSLSLVKIPDIFLVPASFIMLNDMPNLTVLELDENQRLSETLCQTMADKLIPRLRAFSFYRESVPNQETLKKMIGSAKKLKSLGLKESANAVRTPPIIYYDLHTGLRIPGFAMPSNKLVSCSFHGYVNLDHRSLEYILMNNSDTLEYLNLSNTNLEGLTDLATSDLPLLKKMKVFLARINHHEQVDDEFVPDTPCSQQLVDVLKLMPELRVLDLTENHHLNSSGFDIVAVLAEHCPLLEELHLVHCSVPAEELVNLKRLKHLKRLFLGNIHSMTSCIGAERRYMKWNECFRKITVEVIPHLQDLVCLSFNLEDHLLPPEDLVSFINNASPKFEALSLATLFHIYFNSLNEYSNRHDFIENLAEKCKEGCEERESQVKMIVHGYTLVHRKSCPNSSDEIGLNCSCRDPNFDRVAPPFMKIRSLVIGEHFDFTRYYPDNVSQKGMIKIDNGYVQLPRFTEMKF